MVLDQDLKSPNTVLDQFNVKSLQVNKTHPEDKMYAR